jgi:site-specific DNA-methyltransferase (adenine-specific)
MSTDLIAAKVDKARMLLEEASSARDAKVVADLARAAEVYALRQKASKEARDFAHAVYVDATALMGEFLLKLPKQSGARGTGNNQHKKKVELHNATPPTLAEIGVGKRESAEAQGLAHVKQTKPDLYAQVRAGKVAVAVAAREVKKQQKIEELKTKAQSAPERPTDAKDPWEIIQGRCIETLAIRKLGCVDLIFADPPYNIGIDYGDGEQCDRLPDHAFLAWCGEWIDLCVKALSPSGSFWLLINDEYADLLGCQLRLAGLHRRSWIKWYETFGVNCANNFNRCSRHLFYCVKNPRRFTFNAEAVNRLSDRQTKYGDKRADPAGKIWDDVWVIPRLVGTSKERIPGFPTQLPLALLRPIIGCSSDPGDLVLDPFCGSATTGVAAVELGRRFVGIEKQEKFVELANSRLRTQTQRPRGTSKGRSEQ